ncbi:MAG: c-type cytochrome [Xanthomonadales bacterium]|nr:c-type cytochrome [Xanthomonadales bacterium]NNL96006.1 c-type cytochrome [Xanthomonadales bacterium]
MKNWIILAVYSLMMVTGTAVAGGDVAAGEAKAAEACAGCHGAAGEGMGDNPPLAGLDKKEHAEMLFAYKDGSKEGAMMQMFSAPLSEEDIWNLAAYYASLGE